MVETYNPYKLDGGGRNKHEEKWDEGGAQERVALCGRALLHLRLDRRRMRSGVRVGDEEDADQDIAVCWGQRFCYTLARGLERGRCAAVFAC